MNIAFRSNIRPATSPDPRKIPRASTVAAIAALTLGATVAGYAAPASATVVYVTVTGTVARGTDGNGLFGSAGADLTGDAFTSQWKFDTSLGKQGSDPTQTYAEGGSGLSFASPLLGDSLTINGQSSSIAGTYSAGIYGYNDGSYSGPSVLAENANGDFFEIEMFGNNSNSPNSITTAFTVTSAGETIAAGYFDAGSTDYLVLNAAVYTESLTDPTAVPEPATLPLFGVGLLGIGLVARRRLGANISL